MKNSTGGTLPASRERLRAQVERLLAEYLRKWGLRDPQVIADHCRRWVREVELAGEYPADAPAAELLRDTVRRAFDEVDAWLDQLALRVAERTGEAPTRRGLLAIELQSSIDTQPTAWLESEISEALLHQLTQAAQPVVPAEHPTCMPAQPLGKLPLLFSPRRWRLLAAEIGAAARDLLPARQAGKS